MTTQLRFTLDDATRDRGVTVNAGDEVVIRFDLGNDGFDELQVKAVPMPSDGDDWREDDPLPGWVTVDGGQVRRVSPGVATTIELKIRPPADARSDTHRLRLDLFNAEDLGDRVLLGPEVAIRVESPAAPWEWWKWLLAVGVPVAAVLIGLSIWLIPRMLGGGGVSVTSVIGMQFDEARTTLEQQGFRVTTSFDEDAPAVTVAFDSLLVYRQDPEPEARAPRDSEVALQLGPAEVAVPSVIGQTPEEASATLALVGLRFTPEESTVIPWTGSEQQAGRIAVQSPGVDEVVSIDTSVRVEVRAATRSVPDVRGQSLESAKAALTASSFAWEVTTVRDTARDSTEVIDQSPEVGELRRELSVIRLTVNESQHAVPDVTGRMFSEIGRRGVDGWTVTRVRYLPTTAKPAGTIAFQNPEAGDPVFEPGEIQVDVVGAQKAIPAFRAGVTKLSQYRTTLENGGFVVETRSKLDSSRTPGTMISVTPAAGQKRLQGSTVIVEYVKNLFIIPRREAQMIVVPGRIHIPRGGG